MNFKTLGIMLDCSRNAVINVKTLKKFIDVISDLGYNALELYMEDTMRVDGEPYLGYMRGGYSASEIKEIDAYASARGVELIPAVQTLAHFTNAVKLPAYREIVDVNDILLIDNDRTYRLIDNIFAAISKNFTSKRVNIGMDEAHMVGLGRYLDEHGFTDRHELLKKHLNRVSEIAKKYGLELHMWSDMFFRLSNHGEYYSRTPVLENDVASALPENVCPVYWDYYHTDRADYDAMFRAHEKFGRSTWFAGGIWSWVGFAPLNRHSTETMKPALKSAARYGVENVFFTMWGDNGKECSFFALLPAIFAISRYADGEFDDRKIRREFYEKYGIEYNAYASLDLPNDCGDDKAEPSFAAKGLFYADPFCGLSDESLSHLEEVSFTSVAKKITSAGKKAGEYKYIFDYAAALCRVLDLKARLGLRIRKAYKDGDVEGLRTIISDMKKLVKLLRIFYTKFSDLWYRENKPFGFEIHDARIGGLICRIDACRTRLEKYIDDGEPIEELENELLPYDNALYFNQYRFTISASEM